MTIYHSCLAKIKVIWERTGVLVGHDEITALCAEWGCANADEFMEKMGGMTDEELKAEVERVKKALEAKRKKRKITDAYREQEQRQYA